MAHENKVVHSINFDDEMRCVDVFVRPDGTFGFEVYRRDMEDGRGWFPIGFHSQQRFATAAAALTGAKLQVQWLADAMSA